MSDTIYRLIQEKLNNYAIGFPATESGIEITLLKKLFSEPDARLFLELTLSLEDPQKIAGRTGRELSEVSKQLEEMAGKGLLFRLRRGEKVRFAAAPYVVGIYEFQVGRMDTEFAELSETYFKEAMFASISGAILPLRTVPVDQSIESGFQIAPYADVKKIIAGKDKIAVIPCVCRVQQHQLDSECDKPTEVCITFGSHADYNVENGWGRYIDQDEALAILDTSEKAGLVAQPGSTINPGGICNCCGDCCGLLRALKLIPNPADHVLNNYTAIVNQDECTSCEACLDRCQIDAITMDDQDLASINPARCIGCGLCITTCPAEALHLQAKPESEQQIPFANSMKAAMETATRRGITLDQLKK
jgi:electron transport complex protein RnfB